MTRPMTLCVACLLVSAVGVTFVTTQAQEPAPPPSPDDVRRDQAERERQELPAREQGQAPERRARAGGHVPGFAGPHDRLQHMAQAIQHLRAAEMGELAEQVALQAEHLQQRIAQAGEAPRGPRPGHAPGPGIPRGPHAEPRDHAGDPRIERLTQAVRELSEHVERMQGELKELRERAQAP